MRVALDGFEVEGIGHNLPFLSAVMDHPKFVSRRHDHRLHRRGISRRLSGRRTVTMRHCGASRRPAAAMNRVAEIRRARISGTMDNHERKVGDDWNVRCRAGFRHEHRRPTGRARPSASPTARRHSASRATGRRATSLRGWTSTATPLVLKVGKISGGFRIRSRGADLKVHVRTPAAGRACAPHAREGGRPTRRRLLLCPMPGPGGEAQCGRGRRGAGGPGALHRRGDEDGEHPARRDARPRSQGQCRARATASPSTT